MTLAEPMTMATDYVLALLGGWLGWRLWSGGPVRRWWAAAFWAMGLAALLGGTSHGLAPMLSPMAHDALWRGTMVAIGAGAVLLLQAVVAVLGGGRWWSWLLALEFALYASWVCFFDSDFRFAVLEYGTALCVVLAAHLVLALRRRAGAWEVVTGVLISFLAAAIQQSGLALHPDFNHNDLYHVVQMVGLVFLYRGAVALEPATKQTLGA